MRVTMTAASKRIVRLDEAPAAQRIIKELRDDESTAAEYAVYAVDAAGQTERDWCVKVYEATAEIAKNSRVQDAYFEGSADLDVWVNATVKTSIGFCIIGAYLTDIWAISGDNAAQIAKKHMYVRKFRESK